jgi:MtrB/PioB family decaheme-associated outer membrane protein
MMPTKAPVSPPVLWWYEGFAEIGGRTYLNSPNKDNLGRFYRYEDWSPGVFGNFYFGAHRTGADPFDITASGFNIGWDDQAYELNLSQPGSYYLTFGWDETPHVYSTGARTTYSGDTFLTTPTYPGFTTTTPNAAAVAANQAFVDGNSHTADIGFRRDTATAAGRWTPNDNWDITADYSHLHRHGTQPGSAVTFAPPAGRGGAETRASIQFAKPVDDTTQDGNVKAEYSGSSPWGKPFNVALGYGISVYNNDDKSVTFQNPWVAGNTLQHALYNQYSLWPDNQAQNLTVTGGAGLPLNSRYMGTFQYSWMTQDDSFLPSTSNPLVAAAMLGRSSLGGDARTVLSNNVLHTQITPNLDSNLRYRYYDYHSNQSPMTVAGVYANPDTGIGLETETAYPVNFNKQNASAELVYRPWKWLDLGAAYEWERWNRAYYGDSTNVVTGAVADPGEFDMVTNENAVKVYGDAKWGWSTLRASLRYGERRLDGDYINPLDMNDPAYRIFYVQNVNSTVFKSSWAVNVTDTVTITPSGGYLLNDYPANGVTTIGISSYESWNAGADITWAITPMAALYASYMYEDGARETFQRTIPSPLVYHTRDLDSVFIVGGKWTAIPEKLFLNVSYTYSKGTSQWNSDCGPGGCNTSPMPIYPDTHNTNQRVDAWAKYVFDEWAVRAAGFVGKPYVKARVVWEKNANDSWQNIEQQLGMSVNPLDSTMARSIFLGMPNPNYNVVVGMLSFGMKW